MTGRVMRRPLRSDQFKGTRTRAHWSRTPHGLQSILGADRAAISAGAALADAGPASGVTEPNTPITSTASTTCAPAGDTLNRGRGPRQRITDDSILQPFSPSLSLGAPGACGPLDPSGRVDRTAAAS